jgi:hypothetical protein
MDYSELDVAVWHAPNGPHRGLAAHIESES